MPQQRRPAFFDTYMSNLFVGKSALFDIIMLRGRVREGGGEVMVEVERA